MVMLIILNQSQYIFKLPLALQKHRIKAEEIIPQHSIRKLSPRKPRFFISVLSLFSHLIAGVRCRADALPPEPHPHLLANWVQRGRVWRHGVRARHPARGLRPHNPIQLHRQGYDASGQESKRKLAQSWSSRLSVNLSLNFRSQALALYSSPLDTHPWDDAFPGWYHISPGSFIPVSYVSSITIILLQDERSRWMRCNAYIWSSHQQSYKYELKVVLLHLWRVKCQGDWRIY